MKNLWLICLSLLTTTLFVACDTDDDEMEPEFKNEFTYDGTTYALAAGFLSDVGANLNSTHDWDVFLATDGITLENRRFTGMGELIYLDLNTNSNTGLIEGKYTWANTRENLTIVPGSEIFIGYDFATLGGTKVTATDGEVNITIADEVITIEFELTLTDGKTATGQYRGSLQDI